MSDTVFDRIWAVAPASPSYEWTSWDGQSQCAARVPTQADVSTYPPPDPGRLHLVIAKVGGDHALRLNVAPGSGPNQYQ